MILPDAARSVEPHLRLRLTPLGVRHTIGRNSSSAVGRMDARRSRGPSARSFSRSFRGRHRVARVPIPGTMHGRVDPSGIRVSRPAVRARRLLGRLASLALVLEIALALRVAAADAVEWYVRRRSRPGWTSSPTPTSTGSCAGHPRRRAVRVCRVGRHPAFRDPDARAIRCCWRPARPSSASGRSPVRLVQAVLGTLCVYLVYRLTPAVRLTSPGSCRRGAPRWLRAVPLIAAAMAAVNPHYRADVVTGPVRGGVRAADAGLARWAWRCSGRATGRGRPRPIGDGGVLWPWAAARPPVRRCWCGRRGRCSSRGCWRPGSSPSCARAGRSRVRGAVLCTSGSSWSWAPGGSATRGSTAGSCRRPSGWGPASTMASTPGRPVPARCRFMRDPEIWPLDEQDQDAELTRRAIAFARESPGGSSGWRRSSWADTGAPGPMPRGSARGAWPSPAPSWRCPSSRLIALGLWDRRRDLRALGAARRAHSLFLPPCTWSSPARCATASPARCPRWGWRRSDACRDVAAPSEPR